MPTPQSSAAQFPAKVGDTVLLKDGKTYHVIMTVPAHCYTVSASQKDDDGKPIRLEWGNVEPWAYVTANKPSFGVGDQPRPIFASEMA